MLKLRPGDYSWLARAMCVTELQLASLRTCTQWLTTFITTIDTVHIFNYLRVFVTDSFCATGNSLTACGLKHITIPCYFDDPLCMCKKTCCSAVLQ